MHFTAREGPVTAPRPAAPRRTAPRRAARVACGAMPARSGFRRAILAGVVLGVLACASTAALASSTPLVKRASRTISLRAGQTRTVLVPYPDALEFGGARYSGRVKVLSVAAPGHGRQPSLLLVKVLSKASSEGGSLLRVRIRNANAPGTLPVRALITAITRIPASS